MSDFIHFLNGKYVTDTELLISPKDLGYTRGYSVADFLVTHNHHPFKLVEHVERLFKSAKIIGLHIPWTQQTVINWVQETLSKNKQDVEKTVKIIVSGGIAHGMHQADVPTIVIIVDKYIPQLPSYYEKGVTAIAVEFKRQYPEAKHTNYIEAIKQLSTVSDKGVDEVIYYDNTQVFEGAGCNIFAVIDNTLVTPASIIVQGITRNVLLEILNLAIPIEVKNVTMAELSKTTEIFLTGSSKKVRGVIAINGKLVGNGKVGKVTKEVAKQYEDYLLKNK